MKERSVVYRCLEGILYPLMWLIFRPTAYTEDGKRIKKPSIDRASLIVSNHIGHMDGTVICYLYRHYILHNLAAKDRFEQGGLMEWYLRNGGCIPIDRKGISTDWLHASVKYLVGGKESVVIFPEGMHGKDHEILPFHSGAATIAAISDAPVIMFYNHGPYRAFRRTKVIISEPFHLERPKAGMTADYISEQTELLHAKMVNMQKEWHNLCK